MVLQISPEVVVHMDAAKWRNLFQQDEFKVTKAILLCMLKSILISDMFTNEGLQAIEEYVLGVLRYEHKFLSCDYKTTFTLEVFSNSAHAGTNHSGSKQSIKSVNNKAHHSLGMSTFHLVEQDIKSHIERQKICCNEYTRTKRCALLGTSSTIY
jgi:hypothetical protein